MLGEFLECSTTSIAGVSGRGAVVLVRWNGLPLPNDVWGAGSIDVDYTLADLTTVPTVPKLEKGLGVITSGLLIRTLPRVTWDGTTFDEVGPTQLAFGSAPVLGNVRVRIAPNADQFIQGPPAIYTGGSSAFAGWLPTANLLGAPGKLAGAGPSYAPNTEYYVPFLCGVRGTITGMGLYVTTPVTSALCKMGIYGVGVDGLPGPCIAQSQPIDVSAAGLRGDVVPASWIVRPGPLMLRCAWFYVGLIFSVAAVESGAVSRASIVGPTPLGQIDDLGWGSIVQRSPSNSYTTGLPGGTPTGVYSNPLTNIPNSVPSIVLKFAN